MVKNLHKMEREAQRICNYERFLPEMLRSIRLSVGLSQADIANCLKLSRSTYTYYECGKTSPSFYTLVAISAILGVPPQVFYDRKLYKELMVNRDFSQKRPQRRVGKEVRRLGDLSPEERQLILQARISGPDALESLEQALFLLAEEEAE